MSPRFVRLLVEPTRIRHYATPTTATVVRLHNGGKQYSWTQRPDRVSVTLILFARGLNLLRVALRRAMRREELFGGFAKNTLEAR